MTEARGLMLDLLAAGSHTLVDAFTLRVLHTGRSIRLTVLSAELLRLWTQPEFGVYLDAHPMTSLLVVPIRGGRRRVGALRVWRERAEAAYSESEALYVERLVDYVVAGLPDLATINPDD